ncbi:unnamed protein product [Brachionus calyciflorus]|uniref:Mid2 domain-containing protein n=1 Tax=Brachionus calyciflorus TaxID=104777 RepID=A0A813TBH6_9BILA|nr:unnamed protein product [Brachionus calyciflorus]
MIFRIFVFCLIGFVYSQTDDSNSTETTLFSETTSEINSTEITTLFSNIMTTNITTATTSDNLTSNFTSSDSSSTSDSGLSTDFNSTSSILSTTLSFLNETTSSSNEVSTTRSTLNSTTPSLNQSTSTVENNTARVVGIMVAFGVAGIIIVIGFLVYVWRKSKLEENKYITLADKLNTTPSRPASPGTSNMNEDFFINNTRNDTVFTNPAFNLNERNKAKTSNDDFKFNFDDIKTNPNNESTL